MTAPATFPNPVRVRTSGYDKVASDVSFKAALDAEREAAQARYVAKYRHPSALYSKKGPFS